MDRSSLNYIFYDYDHHYKETYSLYRFTAYIKNKSLFHKIHNKNLDILKENSKPAMIEANFQRMMER